MKKPLRRLLAGLTLTAALTAVGITTTDILATPQGDTGWGAPAGDTGWGSLPNSSDTTGAPSAGTDVSASVTPLIDTAWG